MAKLLKGIVHFRPVGSVARHINLSKAISLVKNALILSDFSDLAVVPFNGIVLVVVPTRNC